MVQANDNIDKLISNNSNMDSLDEDDEVKLDSSSLRDHKTKDNSFEIMHIGQPFTQTIEKQKKFEEATKLFEDASETFDFIPIFMREYKIITKESKKGKGKLVTETQNSKVSISTTIKEKTTFKTNFDEVKQPMNLKEVKKIYGRGFELMKQLGKGCDAIEQGIHIPINPKI